ncbi:MAG: DUF2294 family protein [Pirellulales bacterium]|nr:DUF2294 family protein [Pirellulales bacterium]
MQSSETKVAKQVALVASEFQRERTGHAPQAVTVVMSEDTLVITLHEALTPAELTLAQTPVGAAQVQNFHRQLFAASLAKLQKQIEHITGRRVREAAAEIETATGTVIHAFTTGAMVQVFLFAARDGSAPPTSRESPEPDAQADDGRTDDLPKA